MADLHESHEGDGLQGRLWPFRQEEPPAKDLALHQATSETDLCEEDGLGDSMVVLDKTYRAPDVVQDIIDLRACIGELQRSHEALILEVGKEKEARLEFEKRLKEAIGLREPCDEISLANDPGALNIIDKTGLQPLLEVSGEASSQASASLQDIPVNFASCFEMEARNAAQTVRISDALNSGIGVTQRLGGLPDNRVSDCFAPSPQILEFRRVQSPSAVNVQDEVVPASGRPSMWPWASPSAHGNRIISGDESSQTRSLDSTYGQLAREALEAPELIANSTRRVEVGITGFTEKAIQHAIRNASLRDFPKRVCISSKNSSERSSPRVARSPANEVDQDRGLAQPRQVTVEIRKLHTMKARMQKMQEEASSLRSQLQDLNR